jgi:hypothetical protein
MNSSRPPWATVLGVALLALALAGAALLLAPWLGGRPGPAGPPPPPPPPPTAPSMYPATHWSEPQT